MRVFIARPFERRVDLGIAPAVYQSNRAFLEQNTGAIAALRAEPVDALASYSEIDLTQPSC
jgi:hypothetical protein